MVKLLQRRLPVVSFSFELRQWQADADQITVIPEPGTAMLVGVGLGALAWRRRTPSPRLLGFTIDDCWFLIVDV